MSNHAAGRGAQYRMMAGDVARDGANSGAFETSLGYSALGSDQQCEAQKRRGESLPLQSEGL